MTTVSQKPSGTKAQIFDGYDVTTVSVGTEFSSGVYTPTLVDGGLSLMGYRESLRDPATSATDAIVENSRRHGIGVLLDDGSSFEALYRARRVGAGSLVLGGGPILTDLRPRTEAERQISSVADLQRSVQSLQVEESSWLNLRTDSIDFLSQAVTIAHSANLKVSLRTSRISPIESAQNMTDMLIGAHHLNGRLPVGGALGILQQWAGIDDAAVDRLCRGIASSGMVVTSGLLAIRRAAFPREATGTPFLEELLPVLPHVRYIIEMRRAGGYLAGRRQMAKHTGFQEPTASQKQQALKGWDALTAATCAFVHSGGRLLPASHGPGLGVVPGHGIKEELTLLAHIYGDPVLALRQGTGLARYYLGVRPWSLERAVAESDLLHADVDISDPDIALRLTQKAGR